MPYRITKNCNQCERCAEECPMGAIEQDNNGKFVILKNDCDEGGECVKVCPVGAIVRQSRCLNCRLILLKYIQEYKHLAEDEIKKPLVT